MSYFPSMPEVSEVEGIDNEHSKDSLFFPLLELR